MRVLVCGGRDFNDYEKMKEVLDGLTITQIIEGEARGADNMARQYAEGRQIPVRAFPADWNAHGKAAGPIRNTQMLVEGKPELVIAFPGGRGTANMIEQAEKAGVEVRVIEI